MAEASWSAVFFCDSRSRLTQQTKQGTQGHVAPSLPAAPSPRQLRMECKSMRSKRAYSWTVQPCKSEDWKLLGGDLCLWGFLCQCLPWGLWQQISVLRPPHLCESLRLLGFVLGTSIAVTLPSKKYPSSSWGSEQTRSPCSPPHALGARARPPHRQCTDPKPWMCREPHLVLCLRDPETPVGNWI